MQHYINGEMVSGRGRPLEVYNPSAGTVCASFPGVDQAQALSALNAAEAAFPLWSSLSWDRRDQWILRLKEAVAAHGEELVDLLMLETGKPRETALYDFNMLLDCLSYFSEEVKRLHGSIIQDRGRSHINLISRKPIGVVLGYLAWNFPLLNMGYKLGPILASGCTCVLKPSSLTPLATLRLGEILEEINFPKGVVNIISGRGADIADALSASTIPRMITCIGSTETGRRIIAQSATSIKKYSLELGGNAPVILLPDADPEEAAGITVRQKFDNAGQVCVSPNRIFVHHSRYERFLQAAVAEAGAIGFPGDEGKRAVMGPLISRNAVTNMERLVADALEKGAALLCGGARPAHREGFFFPPTILGGVTRDMAVYQEEIFGPILPVISYGDEEDIVALANETPYGLAAYLYSNDLGRVLDIAPRLEFGTVSVNQPFYDYNLPHGGVKQSGVGKDCSSYSLEEYFDIRRISVKAGKL